MLVTTFTVVIPNMEPVMKITFPSHISETNPLFINDTADVTAKTLFLLFMEQSDGINTVLEKSDFYTNAANFFCNDELLCESFNSLVFAVVNAFKDFVKECPHIKISFTK